MVFEMGLTRQDGESLRVSMRAALQETGGMISLVGRRWPAMLVAYLVSEGIFCYDGGLWPHVFKHLGVHQNQNAQTELGVSFERALPKLGLETFELLVEEDNARRFVDRILIHGGVPRYSLDDFFRLLTSELNRAGGDAADLLARWRAHRTRFTGIDQPVRRFLLFGGEMSHDLLNRCIELVDGSGDPESVGLPAYFRDAYRSSTPIRRSTALRIPRPSVEIDPWDTTGPVMRLPGVDVSGAVWQVSPEPRGRSVRVGAFQDQSVSLTPARSWEIDLMAGGESLRSYVVEGLGDVPIAFFDPVSGRLVRDPHHLALDEMWALTPNDPRSPAVLLLDAANGESLPVIEELPSPTGPWSGFNLACYSLRDLNLFVVKQNELRLPIRVTQRGTRPELVGDIVAAAVTESGVPIHPTLPALSVPLAAPEGHEVWRVRLREKREDAFSQLLFDGNVASGVTELASLIGPASVAEYQVSARGPLGQDLLAEFAVVPGLSLDLPARVLLPEDRGVRLKADADSTVSIVDWVGNSDGWLTVPDDRNEIICTFSSPQDVVRARIRVPRVVWSAVGEGVRNTRFATDQIRIDKDDLCESGIARLMVLTGRWGTSLLLQLVDPHGLPLQQTETMSASGAEGRWTFDLSEFKDTISQSLHPLLELKLLVDGKAISVGHVVARYVVGSVQVVARFVDEYAQVHIEFEENAELHGRVIRLWSLDRAWEPPIIRDMQDAVGGSVDFRGYGAISPGRYRLEFTIEDGWTKVRRPSKRAENTFDISIGTPEDRLTRLAILDPSVPLEALERVACGRRLDQPSGEVTCEEICRPALLAMLGCMEDICVGERPSGGVLNIAELALSQGVGVLDELVGVLEDDSEAKRQFTRLQLHAWPHVLALGRTLSRHTPVLQSQTMRSLWRHLPSWAAFIDGSSLTDDAAARCEQYLSWSPGSQLPRGFAVDQVTASKSYEDLRDIQRMMALVPQGLLHPESLMVAYFQCLMALKAPTTMHLGGQSLVLSDNDPMSTIAADWWSRNEWLLSAGSDDSSDECREQIRAREPRPGTLVSAYVPYGTLVASVVLFDNARTSWEQDAAAAALDEAFVFAPQLVEHDLVLSALLTRTLGGAEC